MEVAMTNIQLIESLKKHFPLQVIKNMGYVNIKDVRLLDGSENQLKDDVVYFGYAEQLEGCIVSLSQLFICDKADDINKNTYSFSNFSTIEEKHLFSAFNYAKDLMLNNLEVESSFSEIINMVLSGKGLNDIINIVAEKLNNPVVVFDLSYKVLAYSDKKAVDNINWSKVVDRGYCSYEFINEIQKLDDVKNSPEDSTSFTVMCRFDDMKKLCSKIISNGRLIGHVLMFENISEISEKHHKLLPLISTAICEALMRDRNFIGLQGSLYENIIYDIITGADKLYIEKRIEALRLKFPKRMCVLVINSSIILGVKHIKGFLIDELKRIIPKSYSAYHDEYIIMVAPVDDDDLIGEKKMNLLHEFAKRESLQIGISYSFSNITELMTYYTQAYSALNLSQQVDCDKIIHTYEANWFYHLINNVITDNTPLGDFCHPALKKLYDYDLINGTNFFETLWVYLKCDCMIKKTAEVLFIHRNSLSYRLERTYEICGIDELNVELKYALISSYKIYNYLGKLGCLHANIRQ
jgi:hypothetical protein